MNDKLREIKNLKIVPENYKSATVLEIEGIIDGKIKIKLPLASNIELKDYNAGEDVELFGLNKTGLVYFVSKILKKDGSNLFIDCPEQIKEIQRRKYSRVPFDGKLIIN